MSPQNNWEAGPLGVLLAEGVVLLAVAPAVSRVPSSGGVQLVSRTAVNKRASEAVNLARGIAVSPESG